MPPQGTPADARANAGATWRGKSSGTLSSRPPDHSHLLGGCLGSVWLHGYALLDALLVVSVIDFCFFPQTPVDCQLAPFGWMPGLCLAAWLFFA